MNRRQFIAGVSCGAVALLAGHGRATITDSWGTVWPIGERHFYPDWYPFVDEAGRYWVGDRRMVPSDILNLRVEYYGDQICCHPQHFRLGEDGYLELNYLDHDLLETYVGEICRMGNRAEKMGYAWLTYGA